MKNNNRANHPPKLTDTQLDQLLKAASGELLNYIKAISDLGTTLVAVTAEGTSEAPGQRAATPGQTTTEHPSDTSGKGKQIVLVRRRRRTSNKAGHLVEVVIRAMGPVVRLIDAISRIR